MMRSKDNGKRIKFLIQYTLFQVFSGNLKFEC
jgi:hypothetical protein